jgi:hypothetical protein
MKLTRKNRQLGEKPVPVPLCPPQTPHGLTRDRTRASAVEVRRLTAWAMARPSNFEIINPAVRLSWTFISCSAMGTNCLFLFRPKTGVNTHNIISLSMCALSSATLMQFAVSKLIYEVVLLFVTWSSMWQASRGICGASVAFLRVLRFSPVNFHSTNDL